jgi:SAM-dependent methyltransferase
MTGSPSAPLPPLSLANRVCGLERFEDPFVAYERLGAEARTALLSLLGEDWSFDGKRVLDFGCGAGRTLRHFLGEARAGTDFWGSDIDEDSIAWLSANLCPPLNAVRNAAGPPLRIDGGFDLIWTLSVFTHLTDLSLAWVAELHRLLTPGGLLVATYMGRYNGSAFTAEEWDEDRIGMNVLRADQSWDLGGPMVLMSDWWVRAHWGRAFEFVAQAPVHGQTWVLLRRRDVRITVDELARPADDPREWAALRHNLVQVEREHAIVVDEITRSYEDSLSWRLTQPLRDIRRRVARRHGEPRRHV